MDKALIIFMLEFYQTLHAKKQEIFKMLYLTFSYGITTNKKITG